MRISMFVVALLWALPTIADDAKVEEDEKLIQGYWLATSVRIEGKELPKELAARMCFIITDNRISFGAVGQEHMTVEYTLDSAKRPKVIDTTHELTPGKPILQQGIYSLKRDRLTLSLGPSGKARPKSFSQETADIFVLKRSKAPKQ